MEKICSFFGHRDVFVNLQRQLCNAIEIAINEYGISTFYVGDRGEFDRQAANAVRIMKHKYQNIKLVLVLPYLTSKLNTYKNEYTASYDTIYIPEQLAGVHPKGAITKRNRIMVDESELIICYIKRDYGGAYNTIKYANRKNKGLIQLD